MKKFLLIIFFTIFCSSSSLAINKFKYEILPNAGEFCTDLLQNLNFPGFPKKKDLPIVLNTELLVEDITKVDGKNLDFNSFYTLWVYWKDPRVVGVLKDLGKYEDTEEPSWLCDYEAKTVWGESRKLFDPVVEFYNQKEKPDFVKERVDWIEILSNGTVQSRVRSNGKFKSKFNFKQFPFDTQTFDYKIYAEFPIQFIKFKANTKMEVYKKNLYKAENEGGLDIPSWKVRDVDYYIDRYKEDSYVYNGFVVEIKAERESAYYLFKIIIPIFFLLVITWSVFWIYGSEIEAKVNISVVTLLALIAYNFIIDGDLPKLSYLTYLDAYILISYFFAGGATILCVYSYLRYRKYKNKINKVDSYAKIFGPLVYGFLNLIVYNYFF
jgi:hypothetical protein